MLCEYLFSGGQVEQRLSKLRAVVYLHLPAEALLYLKEHIV